MIKQLTSWPARAVPYQGSSRQTTVFCLHWRNRRIPPHVAVGHIRCNTLRYCTLRRTRFHEGTNFSLGEFCQISYRFACLLAPFGRTAAGWTLDAVVSIRRGSAYVSPAVGKQFAQQRAMAAPFVLAVTAHGEVGLM